MFKGHIFDTHNKLVVLRLLESAHCSFSYRHFSKAEKTTLVYFLDIFLIC